MHRLPVWLCAQHWRGLPLALARVCGMILEEGVVVTAAFFAMAFLAQCLRPLEVVSFALVMIVNLAVSAL